jgi:LCP family protein required for cell wall assembly
MEEKINRMPAMRRNRPSKLQKSIIVLASLIFLGIGLGAGWFYLTYGKATTPEPNPVELPSPEPGGRINFLLIGVDARPGELSARSDTIIFGSIDLDKKQVYFLSIPRDSLVEIPGNGQDKINAAHAYGGIPLLIETVSQLLNRPIHYYAELDFQGFVKVIDILGGIDFNIEERMYYPWENIDLYPGLQHLDGEQALAYVRYRGYPEGDIARVEKQQAFLRAIIEQHFNLGNVSKIPIIFQEITSYLRTNLPLEKALELAKALSNLKMKDIRTEVLPGNFLTINEISYWGVDEEKLHSLLDELENPEEPLFESPTIEESPGEEVP